MLTDTFSFTLPLYSVKLSLTADRSTDSDEHPELSIISGQSAPNAPDA